MISFKKYSSIENDFNQDFIERVKTGFSRDWQFIVQEKVHGTNTSFLCDGNELQFAKRTTVLADDERFYDYQELVERYRERVLRLFRRIKERYVEVVSISVFGEMFGGAYPHPDVKSVRKMSLIQKGVFYTPDHEFYAFDIYLFDGDRGWYLPVDEANDLFEEESFFYAKTLFQGTLEECLTYPNAFPSKISEWLGLPPLEDNICEGIVIRPVVPMYLNGIRVLIKSKNERFAEKKSEKKRPKVVSEPVAYSEALQALLSEVDVYVTENRLTNVVSHVGEVEMPRDFGKIMGHFSKDILEDFLKEHGNGYELMEKSDQKVLNKELNRLATELVKKVYMRR